MNTEAQTNIDQILTDYLAIIKDGQADLLAAYETHNNIEYMKAIERHERMSNGVKAASDGLYTIITIGEDLRPQK